jgi:hypothetical protein
MPERITYVTAPSDHDTEPEVIEGRHRRMVVGAIEVCGRDVDNLSDYLCLPRWNIMRALYNLATGEDMPYPSQKRGIRRLHQFIHKDKKQNPLKPKLPKVKSCQKKERLRKALV